MTATTQTGGIPQDPYKVFVEYWPEALVQGAVDSWDAAIKKLPSDRRAACKSKVESLVGRILGNINSLRQQGASKTDLREKTEQWIQELNDEARSFCVKESDTGEKLSQIDSKVDQINAPPPAHHEHHADEHHTYGKLFWEGVAGAAAEHTEHLLEGGPWGAGVEVLAHTMIHDPSTSSENPKRDLVLDGLSHVGVVGAVDVFSAEIPGYQIVLGAHVVGKVAKEGETKLQQLQRLYPPAQEADKPSYCEESCLSPSQAIAGAVQVCQLAQLPSKGLHAVQEGVTAKTAQALNTVGLTEENLKKAGAVVREVVVKTGELMGEHPEMLDVP